MEAKAIMGLAFLFKVSTYYFYLGPKPRADSITQSGDFTLFSFFFWSYENILVSG